MNKYDEYKKIFDKNDGIVKTSDFTNAGYHNTILTKLLKSGIIIKLKSGYYEWQGEKVISDVVLLKKMFPDAIICLNSALYLYDYIDRTPNYWHLTVSKNSAKLRFNIDYPNIKVFYVIDRYMEFGVSSISFEEHEIKIFNRERTICDVIRYESKLDKELFNQAIKNYSLDSKKDISRLMKYAKILNIEKKTRMIMGMWL